KKLSIIIPAYNHAHHLKTMLESLLSQKYDRKQAEIIVVDDGSTDNTENTVKKLAKKHKELKYIKQKNAGPGAARNTGVKAACGEILGFLDSDIIVPGGFVEKVLKYFKKHPETDVLEGAVICPDKGPFPLFTHITQNTTGGRYITCNIFYKRELFHKIGGFDERFNMANREDTDLAFSAITAGAKFKFAPEIKVLHPPRKNSYKSLFKNAKFGFFEPLLFKKHSGLFFKKLFWREEWFFPVYYWGYYTLPVFLVIYFVSDSSFWLLAGLFLYASSFAVTLFSLLRKKKFEFKPFLQVFFLMLFIPYLRLFRIIAGFIKFRGF
ncbi:MAG: glycosyltransferase, partial [Candidatus Goldiibacteriota bacterium]